MKTLQLLFITVVIVEAIIAKPNPHRVGAYARVGHHSHAPASSHRPSYDARAKEASNGEKKFEQRFWPLLLGLLG
uniref:Secreted protein n=1 Tax=Panagrellus redivivus TaxID=6233 RepID=A0A7E4VU86_PANRE